MYIPKPHTLQHKFLAGLAVAVIGLGGLFATVLYMHLRTVLEEEVHAKARLVFSQIDAIQGFVREALRPRMMDSHPGEFIIEAMSSSYISRQVMDRMDSDGTGHIYRRVAMGARNPDFEANPRERGLISHFRMNPDLSLWTGYDTVGGKQYYVIARPVAFSAPCMVCHGDPADAPPQLVEMYGDRGFGQTLDGIAGLDYVGVPVSDAVSHLRQSITTYFAFLIVCALVFFSSANVVFRVLVVRNLRRLTGVFRRTLGEGGDGSEGSEGADGTGGLGGDGGDGTGSGIRPAALIARLEQGDEIEELVDGIEQVAHHLADARARLQSYADNLRQMVDERTAELSREAGERRADVDLFVKLFEDMRGLRTRDKLWRYALPQIARRFGARRIAYVCTFASHNFYAWPERDRRPDLPAPLADVLTGGCALLRGASIFVPVEAQAGAAEGLLCLEWDDADDAARQNLDVLAALGRQLGTVAENLSALDRLVRHMDVLQSVFEGIRDPLALVDGSGSVIIANEGARRLSLELSGGAVPSGDLLAALRGGDGGAPGGNPGGVRAIGACAGGGDTPGVASTGRAEVGIPAPAQGAESREVVLPGGRSFMVNLYPLARGADEPGRAAVYVRETTLEKRMFAQVSQSEKMVTVGKLAAGLAHEINNPLGVILCYAELLRRNTGDAQQQADLDVILRHTRQAQRVLRDLLNFARPKAAGAAPSDIARVARSVAEVFGVQAAKKFASVMAEVEPDLPPVTAGEQALEQIFSNLVLNALDALPASGEGRVRIRVRRGENPGEVVATVADSGTGVPGHLRKDVFDPFFTTKEMGTGLGLAVVYGLVVDAGGSVTAGDSAELGGAEFTVRLPVVGAVCPTPPAAPVPSADSVPPPRPIPDAAPFGPASSSGTGPAADQPANSDASIREE
uniref:histidine kinase n=1 Tax=Nitratidesulfovibrio vulgaris (strain DSM 19637 / Miyazaki F) TaxID=883 RepID=B8DRM3_NITV9